MSTARSNSSSNQCSDWLKTLDALQEANLILKGDLTSEARRVDGSKDLLEALEGFLQRSLNKDMHIALLRQDIMSFQKRAGADGTLPDTQSMERKLGQDVAMMCEQFALLKADFSRHFNNPEPLLSSASSLASARSGL